MAHVGGSLIAAHGAKRVAQGHPFTSCFDDDGERVIYSYFEQTDDPFIFDSTTTYTDGEELSASRTYEWNHSICEIISALIGHGLVLGSLTEHDWTLFQQFPWLVEKASGQLVVPEGRPRIPLSFTLLAQAPSKVEEPLSSSEA